MLKMLRVLLIFLFGSPVSMALAAAHGSRFACPYYATAATDGCLGAPPYVNSTLSYQKTNLLTDTTAGLFQSGQASAGVASINYNLAGKDFAVGVKPNTYCNGTYVALDNPTMPCSTTAGATNLIDGSLYDWNKDMNAGFANFGCASGSYTPTQIAVGLEIECKVTGNVDISGVDFSPNGVCHTFYAYTLSTVTAAFRRENYIWKMSADLGTNGVNGCTNPIHGGVSGAPIYENFTTSNNISVFNGNGIEDDQNSQTYVQQAKQTAIDLITTGGSVTEQYVACLNQIGRCTTITGCGFFNTSFNVSTPLGYWPLQPHSEFALYYNARYGDSTCYPNQTIINQTSWTNAVTNAPEVTASISTSEASTVNVSSLSYDAPSGILTLTLASNYLVAAQSVGSLVYVQNLAGAGASSVNRLWWPISSSPGAANVVNLQVPTGLGSLSVVTNSTQVYAAEFGSLTMEYTTSGYNLIGGASTYYTFTGATTTVGGTQTGTYGVGDILAISGTTCAVAPQILVTAVSGGAVTAAFSINGGQCSTQYSSTTALATTCLSGTCVAGSGAGLTIEGTFGNWTTGYGIQVGEVAYASGVLISNNFIDPTGVASQPNAVYYQETYCAGSSTYSNNLRLTDGSKITAGSGIVSCPVGP